MLGMRTLNYFNLVWLKCYRFSYELDCTKFKFGMESEVLAKSFSIRNVYG